MLERYVETLSGNRAVLAENGPLRLVIQAFSGEKPNIKLATEAAQYSFDCLERVAKELELLRQPHPKINVPANDEITGKMIESVCLIGDRDLTPMAAVAGTIADYVADYIFDRGASRVIVDNGGDIAIRLQVGEIVRVGFRPEISRQEISHLITIDSRSQSWGVNTSGLGGRSLTRGIASGVTVFAGSSSVADAAATAIANSCFAYDENIRQVPANSIDPHTDLGVMPVTVSVGDISDKTVNTALANGQRKAGMLINNNSIQGALLAVGGKFFITPHFRERVGEITEYSPN